ncbi:ABC transporter substrate-binding protein [Paenibacillus sp. NPDC058071]|uniref:ABC transporter substrate-binding protein n=1 Tax=Paenibacillus sp. NPDC058071 TaxID=3346326 RepID=UPI0036DAEF65
MKSAYKAVAFLLVLTLILAGCTNANTNQNRNKAQEPLQTTVTAQGDADVTGTGDGIDLPPPEQQKITLRLNWKYKGEFAPFYVTKEKGIFAKYGLEVAVEEGSGSVSVLQVISQNKEEIGVTSAVEPVQGVEMGMPVKIIASYMSRSPIMILSYANNPVKSPKDLEGKSLVSSSGSTFTSVYEKFLAFNDTNYDQVEHIMVETGARNTLFLNKGADAVAVFSTNEYPIFEQTLGEKLVPLYLADYGFDLTGLSLIANDKFMEANPNTVKRFLAAVNEGFAYTLEHPEEAAQISKKLFPEVVDEAIVVEQIKRTGELALRPEGKAYGWIDGDKLSTMVDRLLESDLMEKRQSVEHYFTNEYLPQ